MQEIMRRQRAAVFSSRQHFAHERHDAVTQSLYSQTLFAQAAQNALEEGNLPAVHDNLCQLRANSAVALREMCLLLSELRPIDQRANRLVQNITDRLDWVERRLGIAAECRIEGNVRVSRGLEKMLLGVMLEALNNALRHGQATQISITIRVKQPDIYVTITDNGIGFDLATLTATASKGAGLANMRERVHQHNGRFEVVSTPGQGTSVHVSVRLVKQKS